MVPVTFYYVLSSFGHTLVEQPLKETISILIRNYHLGAHLYALTLR